MSTNNNAAQTLFRFVSLRNPQLTETNNKNFGFIQRPENISGDFDIAVESRPSQATKLQAMASIIRTVEPEMFKTEKEIETSQFSELLKIGRKIAKKERLSDGEMQMAKEYYRSLLESGNFKPIESLWNNLIYQVVSQKDFYVKEGISHILKAIHLGFVQNTDFDEEIIKINGENPLEKALDAKIVLPNSLFVEDENGANIASRSANTNNLSSATLQRLKGEAEKEAIANNASLKKAMLQKLNTELEQLQKKFHKASQKAYQQAYEAYQLEFGAQLAAYEVKLNEIDEAIENKAPQEELDRLYDQLRELEVPPFEFSYKSEINFEDLQNGLTPESFELFLEMFSEQNAETLVDLPEGNLQIVSARKLQIGTTPLEIDSDYQTYSEVFAKLNAAIATQSLIALDNTALPQQQYVNIGGATIPVAANTGVTHLAYSLMVNWTRRIFTSGSGSVAFSFEVENPSWEVASAKLTATTNMGTFEENKSAIAVVNNKIVFPGTTTHHFANITHLKIDIYFANGRATTLELSNLVNNQLYNGLLILKPVKTELPDLEGSTEQATPKRKNFGIKRLGVADYLKVVQSVHAYVPGEVSNIENVMASELRHKQSTARDYSDVTDTTAKSQETEKISDTTKTSRTDMQTEVAKELQKQQSFSAHAKSEGKIGTWTLEVGAEYANNTAQMDSTRQAVMKSQEITERAMERVLTKISEERVQKIIKEYTETNVHEYDNRGKVTDTDNPDAAQPKHITGVYRWIDKKMKNQIYNYGKRAMFEFMVPEPARLHRLATAVSKAQVLTAPVDPRKSPTNTMANPKVATKELLEYWAGIYNISLDSLTKEKVITGSVYTEQLNTNNSLPLVKSFSIESDFVCKELILNYSYSGYIFSFSPKIVIVSIPNYVTKQLNNNNNSESFLGLNIENNLDFYYGGIARKVNLQFQLKCSLKDGIIDQWKQEQFNKIIAAYEKAYQAFLDEQKRLDEEQKAKEAEAKEKQGNFYRYMEADVLKHNCIAYLLQDYLHILGQNFTNGETMPTFEVILDEKLDQYTALAKFMEQAFEWEIMDYTFYPYYWANRNKWQEMYVSESVDPLFRSFLQAGMARVIVTVKPGFEDAVQFFLETGLIWNGGEVPVIGDPMYLSIVDEMREPTGIPQGKFWITRVPTTLTILQEGSAGLQVEQALPIFPESDPTNCENPLELEQSSEFGAPKDQHMIGGGTTDSTLFKYLEY